MFYFRAFSHCATPVKVSLAALDSTFPPSAFPLARSTTAPGSAAGVVTGRAPKGQRAGEPDNWIFHPARCSARAFGTMNQSTLNLGDYAPDPGFTIAVGEQPQQRFEAFGAGALSDTELIAIMLHTGIHGHSVLGLASQLIAQAGSIAGLASWQPEDFRRLKGIGQAKGRQLAALIEIGRRMIKQPAGEAPMLNRPELIAAHMAPYVRGLEVEKFWVLCLNRKNRLKKLVEVTSGTATSRSWSRSRRARRPQPWHIHERCSGVQSSMEQPLSPVSTITHPVTRHPQVQTCRSQGSSGRRPRPSTSSCSITWSSATPVPTQQASVFTAFAWRDFCDEDDLQIIPGLWPSA